MSMPNVPSEPALRERAGKIGPIRREIIFEPLPAVPLPAAPPPEPSEMPEEPPVPVPS
jgi:hypothetical protein